MSSLRFFYFVQCCAYERRSTNSQINFCTFTKAQFELESPGNIQNLCANVPVMWRKT